MKYIVKSDDLSTVKVTRPLIVGNNDGEILLGAPLVTDTTIWLSDGRIIKIADTSIDYGTIMNAVGDDPAAEDPILNRKLITKVEIGKNVTHANGAFLCCSNLTSVIIPKSVVSLIDTFNGTSVHNCNKLTDVHYLGKLSEWRQIDFGVMNTTPETNGDWSPTFSIDTSVFCDDDKLICETQGVMLPDIPMPISE